MTAKTTRTDESTPDPERFEDQLEHLEAIVAQLEDESVGLEASLELFERGMELARSCRARLESVEARVQRLLESDDVAAATEPLDPDPS